LSKINGDKILTKSLQKLELCLREDLSKFYNENLAGNSVFGNNTELISSIYEHCNKQKSDKE